MERWVGWGVIAHHLRVMAQATVHEPEGVAIHPCHGVIRGETSLIYTCSQRVLHHNQGLAGFNREWLERQS